MTVRSAYKITLIFLLSLILAIIIQTNRVCCERKACKLKKKEKKRKENDERLLLSIGFMLRYTR